MAVAQQGIQFLEIFWMRSNPLTCILTMRLISTSSKTVGLCCFDLHASGADTAGDPGWTKSIDTVADTGSILNCNSSAGMPNTNQDIQTSPEASVDAAGNQE